MTSIQHQYVERNTGKICTESLFGDRLIRLLYSEIREQAPVLFRALTGAYASSLLAFINFQLSPGTFTRSSILKTAIGLDERLDASSRLNSARRFFERKIPYLTCRPMPDGPESVVSPADAKVIVGSLREHSWLFVKHKLFDLEELLGKDKGQWISAFRDGDFGVFRLTPEKYHYNHAPVSGRVEDFYAVEGSYHSCNPSAMVALVTPCSKNKRFVTVIDTDVPGGSRVGLVAMVEVVALMIGDVVQVYSEERYDDPQPVSPGMFVKKGAPKSLYRPGSSTDVLLFQCGRIEFAEDLV
ncbi:MAG: phosphatidylserine decarboxylase, partial [Pseudomonadota bacterium]